MFMQLTCYDVQYINFEATDHKQIESASHAYLSTSNSLKGQCHGSTAHPKYARTWKTVCQQLIKLGVKYDILFIIPSLLRTSLPCFKNWRLLHLFQSCSINFKRFFAPFILANQRRDTAPLMYSCITFQIRLWGLEFKST
jgi:hypothetical protein